MSDLPQTVVRKAACRELRAARNDPKAIFVFEICESCAHAAAAHRHLWPVIMSILREASPGLHDISTRIAGAVGKLKQFRAIANCFDKTATNFLAAIHLATIWLN